MDLEIVSADPAGNITVFVLTPLEDTEKRSAAVKALMADPDLKAEQIGFVIPPRNGDAVCPRADGCTAGRGLWRLEMMGGEFCGNAARSFGLLLARRAGLSGRHSLMVEISGMPRPVPVHIDTEAGTAGAEIPGPLAEMTVEHGGRRFPVYIFEGISHVIAEDTEPDEKLAAALLKKLDDCAVTDGGCSTDLCRSADGCHPSDACHSTNALGVMFYDTRRGFMRPLVHVRAAGTTVFESSCGSGSAALGVRLARDVRDGDECFSIAQPGGVITVRVLKQRGAVRRLSIGGEVRLGSAKNSALNLTH